MAHIVWLDNDVAETKPYVRALEKRKHTTIVVNNVSDCEEKLASISSPHCDLLILDVMIPMKTDEEEQRYPPDVTQRATITGLAVWLQWRQRLEEKGTKVLVLTVRLDQTVKCEFVAAGLPADAFATKLDLSDTLKFVQRVEAILEIKENQ